MLKRYCFESQKMVNEQMKLEIYFYLFIAFDNTKNNKLKEKHGIEIVN